MLLTRSRPWRNVPPRKDVGPLRCVFVITSMPVGGAETLLVNMMRRVDRKQVRPEVICLKEPGPLGERISGEFPLHANLLSEVQRSLRMESAVSNVSGFLLPDQHGEQCSRPVS